MRRLTIITAMAMSYFVFAILLNSVGTVILQSIQSLGITKPEASILEGFKDISIALVSFFVASVIPRIGYKVALLIGLSVVTALSLIVPTVANFLIIKLLFSCIGASFALVKVSVYTLIGQLTDSTRAHTSLLNTIEGIFMLGSLFGYWLFSMYIDPKDAASLGWMDVYYPLATLTAIAFILVFISKIEKPQAPAVKSSVVGDFIQMLQMSYQRLILIFVISIFLYVLIEQSIGTWLPTFNNEVLKLPVSISVQITSIFAAALAVGRLLAGQVLKKVHWYKFLIICLVVIALLILLTLPMAEQTDGSLVTHVLAAPLAAYLLPLIGLFMAPIYPVLNSVMLSSLEKDKHAAMTGLIVVFSALGGTTGSLATGLVFDRFGGQVAFYMSLIPICLITLSLYFFRSATRKA